MAKSQPITVVGYLVISENNIKPLTELTAEEEKQWAERRDARFKSAMADYYRQHPDEFELLEDAAPDAEIDFYI
ncbi:MAG: hypothetical protein J6B80_05905 [Clostridia bacterium]|nr:hypothetical protein [Clostridia bacterium]